MCVQQQGIIPWYTCCVKIKRVRSHTHSLCAATGHYTLAHAHAVCRSSSVCLHARSHTHVYAAVGHHALTPTILCAQSHACVGTSAHTHLYVQYHGGNTLTVYRNKCVRLHTCAHTHMYVQQQGTTSVHTLMLCAAISACVCTPAHTLMCVQQHDRAPRLCITLPVFIDTCVCTYTCACVLVRVCAYTPVCAVAKQHALAHTPVVCRNSVVGFLVHSHTQVCSAHSCVCSSRVPCTCTHHYGCRTACVHLCAWSHTHVCAAAGHLVLAHTHMCAESVVCVCTPAHTLMCVQQHCTTPRHTPMRCTQTQTRVCVLHALTHTSDVCTTGWFGCASLRTPMCVQYQGDVLACPQTSSLGCASTG